MGCSIISETIKVMINDNGRLKNSDIAEKVFGSALQNPDMSHLQLKSLLRQQKSDSTSSREGRTMWNSIVAQQSACHANTNDVES